MINKPKMHCLEIDCNVLFLVSIATGMNMSVENNMLHLFSGDLE